MTDAERSAALRHAEAAGTIGSQERRMSDPAPPFALFEGVELDLTPRALILRTPGAALLDQALGRSRLDVETGGDLTVRLPETRGRLRSGAVLRVHGAVDADILHAREIVLGDAPIRAMALVASERIQIGAARLSVDLIIAPEVVIDRAASGRVTVIESHNEREPTRIKGGFTIAEHEELFGDTDAFLAERGAERLPPREDQDDEPLEAFIEYDDLPPLDDESDEVTIVAAPRGDDEDVGDPVSIAAEDLEPVMDDELVHPLHGRLADAVLRIEACYDEGGLPAPVVRLRALVDDGDYDGLRMNITDMWNGVVSHHMQLGVRPHLQVTHAFKVIHGLVQA